MSVRDEVMAWLRGPHLLAMGVRDEVTAQLRGLHPRMLIAGSWVLAGLLLQLLARAIRAGLTLYRKVGQEEPEAKPVPARKKAPALLRKKKGKGAAKAPAAPEGEDQEGTDAEGEEETDEAEDAKKAKLKPKGKATTAADGLEKLAINGLGVLVALVVLATAAGPLRDAAARVIGPYLPIITAGLVVAWIIAAALLAPDPKATPEGREHDKSNSVGEWCELTPEQEAAACEAAAGRALLHYVVRCVHTAVQEGRRGIHIVTMIEGMPGNADVSLFRTECDRYNIPTRKLQIRNVGNTWGVHVDDLEAALGMPLADALDALAKGPEFLVVDGQVKVSTEASTEGPAHPPAGNYFPVLTNPPVEAPAQPPARPPTRRQEGPPPGPRSHT